MIGWLMLASLLASLLLTIRALGRGSWWMMALAAVLALPINVAHIPFFLSWLFACLQIAMAVALRWRVGVAGWWALLLVGLGVVLVGGPGTILLDWHLSWILLAGPLVGFIALAWQQPPWTPARPRSDT
jgi:hypothetical protein